jgi:hypothetical protein
MPPMIPANSATNIISVSDPGWHGRFRIYVTQLTQDESTGTSVVRVYGTLFNDNDWRVEHLTPDIERHISGSGSWYPDPFSIDIAPNYYLHFISHNFTIPHDSDGTKSVTFTIHYGLTDTPTFNGDKSISVSMELTPLPIIYCGWVRVGGIWKKAVPYVRSGGKWHQAVPYVRTGGVWKSTR